MTTLSSDLLPHVIACVERSGDLLAAEFHRSPRPRGHGDKAEIDREIEYQLKEQLLALIRCRFVGEETGAVDHPDHDLCWLVDPHDGTSAFLQGHRGSAVSVALLQNGVPALGVVYAPLSPDRGPDLIAGMLGMPHLLRNGEPIHVDLTRRPLAPGSIVFLNHRAASRPIGNGCLVQPGRFASLPSIAYRLARVAVGDGVVAVSTSGPGAVDYAGGHALLLLAGGVLLNERGQPVSYSKTGASAVHACFGGAPEAARELASRAWGGASGEKHMAARVSLGWPRTTNETELDRATGCLLGQVIGDSLGALVEFEGPESIARRYPDGVRELHDGGHWNTLAGQPTDDSELALALARTIAGRRDYNVEMVAEAYGRWHASDPFDVGTTTGPALSAASRATSDKATAARQAAHRDSQSNGSLMRVSPIGVWARDPDVAADAARQDSGLSHPNPICVAACAVYAAAIAAGVAGADRHGMLATATHTAQRLGSAAPTVVAALEAACGGMRPDSYTHHMSRVVIAFQNAFYHLAHTPDFEAALVDTIGRGGDTDTNGAIAGALLGAAGGRRAIPSRWTSAILGCRPVKEIGARRPRPCDYWPDDVVELAEALLVSRQEAGK